MNQAGIEPLGTQLDGLAPRTFDVPRAHQIVINVFKGSAHCFCHRVDQVELALSIGKIRCPDATGLGNSPQIELIENTAQTLPVHQVTRVIQAHARQPGKRRGNHIVVIACAAQARIGMKPRQNGVGKKGGTRKALRSFLWHEDFFHR